MDRREAIVRSLMQREPYRPPANVNPDDLTQRGPYRPPPMNVDPQELMQRLPYDPNVLMQRGLDTPPAAFDPRDLEQQLGRYR